MPGVATAISTEIDNDLETPGVSDVTAARRGGGRLVKAGNADYLLPTVIHCESPRVAIATKEYMFPFVTVVQCPEAEMLGAIGPTLVCSAITCNPSFRRSLVDAVHIAAEPGPVPDDAAERRLAPEGNLIDFLYRARAFQTAEL